MSTAASLPPPILFSPDGRQPSIRASPPAWSARHALPPNSPLPADDLTGVCVPSLLSMAWRPLVCRRVQTTVDLACRGESSDLHPPALFAAHFAGGCSVSSPGPFRRVSRFALLVGVGSTVPACAYYARPLPSAIVSRSVCFLPGLHLGSRSAHLVSRLSRLNTCRQFVNRLPLLFFSSRFFTDQNPRLGGAGGEQLQLQPHPSSPCLPLHRRRRGPPLPPPSASALSPKA